VAQEQSRLTPPGTHDGPSENLFQRILANVAVNNRSAALEDIDLLLRLFPDHPRLEVVSYLKAELDFLAGPPEETYAAATQGWKDFLDHWPNSALSSRAHYKMAEADRLLGMDNEAAGQFALLADERDDAYSRLALLKAADIFMGMGLTDEARKILTPIANQGLAERLGWEVYARVGAADFYQGFYGQAADILREVMRQVPDIADTFPDILYILGETYHYLGQPGLSRNFLIEAINMLSGHPKTDIILTRIGDSYRLEGMDQEAIAIYGAASRNYSAYEGGLISKVRLADMGSLHSLFSQENVFGAWERGSRQATVGMYKTIMDSGFASPLMQLAQLKIGTALAEDGEASEAITWLRDLEINNPRSPLLPEAMPVLSEAVVDEISRRREMGDWQGIADLYADNSYYISSSERTRVESIVAQAYERMGRYQDAREMWDSLAEETPDKRLVRAKGLVVNSLRIGQPLEALRHILDMESEFPEQRRWLDEQLAQAGRALARPNNIEAVNNLLDLRRSISTEPVRRDALSDAITIEIDAQRYDRAIALIKQYRQEYPEDELSQEYLLTLAEIADYQKRPEQAWDIFSQFRQGYPDDQRGREILLGQIEKANRLGRPEDAFRFIELFNALYPRDPAGGPLLIEKMDRLWEAGLYDESRDVLASFTRDYPEDPRRPEILMKHVEREWEKGNYPETRGEVEELLADYRDRPELQNLLFQQAEKSWTGERYDEARELTGLIMANYPGDGRLADLLFQQAEKSWTGERHDEAREFTDLIMANYPGDGRLADLLLQQAEKSWTGERHDEARELTGLIMANYPGDSRLADLLLQQAEKSWTGGRHDEARELTGLIMDKYPGDGRLPALLLRQAEKSWTGGRHDEARELTSLIMDKYPDDDRLPDLLLRQAEKSWTEGRHDEARGLTNIIMANYPDDGRLADLFFRQEDLSWTGERYDESRELMNFLLARYPDDERLAGLLLKRAEGNWGRGRFEDALKDWSGFRRAFPENGQVGPSYVDQYKKMVAGGLADEAFLLADEYRRLRPQDVASQADLMLEQAKDYFTLERPDEGLAMWNKFRQTFPEDERNADLLLIQARRELTSGLGDEALGHYQQFLDAYGKDRRQADVYLEAAAAEISLNQRAAAWERLNRYIPLFPAHSGRPQAILDAVDLGRQQGHLSEAVGLLELFRRDYPDASQAPGTFLAEARLKLSVGDQAGAVTTLENGALSRPELDRDPQLQTLLTELYLEEGRVEDWAALVERNLDRAERGTSPSDRFQKYYQLAQVYQELGRNPDVERNLDSALANRDSGVSAENLYAVAQGYKRLLRQEKYRAALLLVRETGDPFWQQVATEELAAETSG
jgi:tetratricopeptide (TPR) repeat protein